MKVSEKQVEDILLKLQELRKDLLSDLEVTETPDKDILEKLIAETMNSLELLFIIVNVQDITNTEKSEASVFIPLSNSD